MAICNYIIKNPNPGGEDIIIPADFGLVTKNSELENAYQQALDGNNSTIIEVIREDIGGSLSNQEVHSIVRQNIDSLDSIVNEINTAVPQSQEYGSFEQALYKHLIDTESTNPNELYNIKETLDAPITIDYFKGVSGVLNQTSIRNEHSIIRAAAKDMSNFGVYSEALKELDIFLDFFKSSDRTLYESNSILANESSLGVYSSNVQDFTIYNKNDPTSLFLGLFKRVGNSLDVDTLNGNFKNQDYFKTIITDGEVELGAFEKDLMSSSKASIERVNKAIELVGRKLSDSTESIDNIKNLIKYLEPGAHLENHNERVRRTNNFLRAESTFERDFKVNRIGEDLKKVNRDRDQFFGEEQSVFRNKNRFLDDNIVIGEDLVYFENVDDYGIITEYRPLSGDNIYIRGLRRVGRTNEYVSQELSISDSLTYRLRERNVLDPHRKSDKVKPKLNNQTVESQTGFSDSLLKTTLTKGDIVQNQYVVGGLYPTHILAGNMETGKVSKIPYSQITSFSSEYLNDSGSVWSDFNSLEIISDMNILSQGDIIKDPIDSSIKTILDSDNTYVYIRRENRIDPVKKSDVQAARMNSIQEINARTINNLKIEPLTQVNQNSRYSSFDSSDSALKGDYFVTSNNEVGLIVDNNGKSIVYTDKGKITSNHNNINVRSYFTNRSIYSKFTPKSLKVNNVKLYLNSSDADNLVKAKYAVPKGTTQNSLYIFPNNHANIGQWVEAKNFNSSESLDFTDFMIKKISSKEGVEVDPHIRKKNNLEYENSLDGLEEIRGYERLSKEIKQRITPFDPGTQFKIIDGNSVSDVIYTVTQDHGDYIDVETSSTTRHGDIRTRKTRMSKDTLFESGSDKSISNLYLDIGNPNNTIIANIIENKSSIQEIENKNAINQLIDRMQKTFGKLGMKVKEGSDGFQDGQYAKTTTVIKPDGDVETSIVLNTKGGRYSDLVHENLHIQLTLLRYYNLDRYAELIDSVVYSTEGQKFVEVNGESADMATKEEYVVEQLVKLSNGENNFLYGNLRGFMEAVHNIIEINFGNDYNFNLSKDTSSFIEFLNTPLTEFYNINSKDSSHPLYNMGLLTAEPLLREWMQRNNIQIIC